MHGYGIAQRIQQISEDVLQLNQGTLYPALLRLEQQGWIQSKWGLSENNRRARYYSVTRSGRKQLVEERANWDRVWSDRAPFRSRSLTYAPARVSFASLEPFSAARA